MKKADSPKQINSEVAMPKQIMPDLAAKFPANNVPPDGTEAYAIARDSNHWCVFQFRVTKEGIETTKILEQELFEFARNKVLERTLNYQIGLVK